MRGGRSNRKQRPNIVSGEEAFAMFEAMCVGKPGVWFSLMSGDCQITMHLMWCAGWWLCISESGVQGIVASYGTDLSHCKALGRTTTVNDAKEALADLIATSDTEAKTILTSGSLEDARERMRAIIDINLSEQFGIR